MAVIALVGIGVLTMGGCGVLFVIGVNGIHNASEQKKQELEADLSSLQSAPAAAIQPTGNLEEIFRLGSDYTDVQRENTEKALTGKVVEWRLPVFEVHKLADARYRIQTTGINNVGTFVTIYAQNSVEAGRIESLMTGSTVHFKGRISGTFMRSINIEPAILLK